MQSLFPKKIKQLLKFLKDTSFSGAIFSLYIFLYYNYIIYLILTDPLRHIFHFLQEHEA